MADPPLPPVDGAPTADETDPDVPPGWDAHWEARWTELGRDDLTPCRVVRIDKGGISVALGGDDERLVVAAKSARRVVVGDVCGLDADAGRIEEILPRRTVFERRSPGVNRDELRLASRPVAANMDLVLVLQPLDPGLNAHRLARELVLAWESGARPVVVLTKADLVDDEAVAEQLGEARRWAPGVEVLAVSARSGDGLGALGRHTGPGRVVALLGSSGSGKSTLVNALAGRSVQLTAEVRDSDRRGRHTTTSGQMVELRDGSLLIDTPGIRGVGLWSADEGLERAFSDLAPFAQRCRFDDCTHTDEPGCGLVEAIGSGSIRADRVEVWRSLVRELEALEESLETREREVRRLGNRRSRRRARRRDLVAVGDEDLDEDHWAGPDEGDG